MATEKEIEEFYDISILDYVAKGKEFYEQKYNYIEQTVDKIDNNDLLKLLEDLIIMKIVLGRHKEEDKSLILKQKIYIIYKIDEIYRFINDVVSDYKKGDVE